MTPYRQRVPSLIFWQTLAGWESGGFSALNPSATMRRAIPAAALGIVGMELLATSFWLTFLQFAPSRKPL